MEHEKQDINKLTKEEFRNFKIDRGREAYIQAIKDIFMHHANGDMTIRDHLRLLDNAVSQGDIQAGDAWELLIDFHRQRAA